MATREVTIEAFAGPASWPTLQKQKDALEVAAAALRAAGIPATVTNDTELWMYPGALVAHRRLSTGGTERFEFDEERSSLVQVAARKPGSEISESEQRVLDGNR